MSLAEENYMLIGFISTERTGKSTYIRDKIIRGGGYDWKTQTCVIITEADPSCYAKYPRAHSWEELKKVKRGVVKFWDFEAADEIEMMKKFRALLQQGYFNNGLLVLEDAGVYLMSNTPKEIRSMVLTRRMYKIDVVAVFHSYRDYPTFMRRRTNHFIVGKNLDNFTEAKELDALQFPNAQGLFEANVKVQQSKDRFIKQLVQSGL